MPGDTDRVDSEDHAIDRDLIKRAAAIFVQESTLYDSA